MMKKLSAVLFLLFLFFAKQAVALEINFGDYKKNLKIVKMLKGKIKKLNIYGKPELKKVEFSKGKDGLCGFVVEYDELLKLGRMEYIKTNKNNIEDCAEELLNFIKRLNYFYAFKELQVLGPEINEERINIIGANDSDFPSAVVGEFMVFVVLTENEFEFFIAGISDRDDILFYASTIEGAKKFLMENIPEIIRENYEGQNYYWSSK